jgi:glycosyltransferase involved in cell wall biosynthesis
MVDRLRVQLVSKPAAAATGLGRYVAELERGLTNASVEVQTAATCDLLPDPLLRVGRRLGYDLATFGRSYPLRAASRPGPITHLTSQTLATLLISQKLPRPVVVTVHDILPYLHRDDPALRVYGHRLDRAMDALAMRGLARADRLVAVSHYTRQTLIDGLGIPGDRIDTVHNGVDLRRFAPRSAPPGFRSRYGLPAGPLVLHVGSEDPRKNVASLLRAVAVLRRNGVEATLVKVGAPAFPAQRTYHLRLCDDLGIADAVCWLDAVPEADLPIFYNAADVFAFPSWFEGFGLPVLEALACGTPVVAHGASSIPELVGGEAALVDADDATAFAAAIAAALLPGDGEAARRRRRQAERFGWDETAAGVVATYVRAQEEHGGASAASTRQTFVRPARHPVGHLSDAVGTGRGRR